MVAEHLLWLQQHYWQSRYSVSFPRLRPCTGGIEPASIMDERQLVQTICSFRLFAPEIELSLSTRESPWFRDRVIPLAINNVSAFSKTQPGGYADGHPELEQFSPHDDRRPEVVAAALTARACSRYGKTGTAIWDAPRNGFETECKNINLFRAVTKDGKRKLVESLPFFYGCAVSRNVVGAKSFFLVSPCLS